MKFFSKSIILNKINKYLHKSVKDQSHSILRLWGNQCEYVIAQKLRRGQQIFTLYAKIWEERALREILKRLRGQVQRHAKGFLLSSAGLFMFDWERERIDYDSVKDQFNEFDYLASLQKETIYCKKCGRRKLISNKIDGIDYCNCNEITNLKEISNEFAKWEPYIEQKGMITWRSEVKPGLYAYKVYVKYTDITAEDFLHVQTDVEYRKRWDNTAINLDIVDTDPSNGNSQIIYWEMLWPKLFANRDYVYIRRYFVDKSRKVIVIVNKSVDHPKCPRKPKNQRVEEYWSFMVIKPTTTFNKPGVEFVLTYFDNPGLSIPKYITTWVAQRQMPDFLDKLHKATLDYATVKKKNEDRIIEYWDNLKDPGFEYPPEVYVSTEEKDNNPARDEKEIDLEKDDSSPAAPTELTSPENTTEKPATVEIPELQISTTTSYENEDDKSGENNGGEGDESITTSEIQTSNEKELELEELNASNERSSWWSYLLPYSYFV